MADVLCIYGDCSVLAECAHSHLGTMYYARLQEVVGGSEPVAVHEDVRRGVEERCVKAAGSVVVVQVCPDRHSQSGDNFDGVARGWERSRTIARAWDAPSSRRRRA